MNHASVLLRGAHIAGIFEGDPRVTGFKEHGQHLAPQVSRFQSACRLDLAAGSLLFICDIGFFKIRTEFVMQVRHIGWRE